MCAISFVLLVAALSWQCLSLTTASPSTTIPAPTSTHNEVSTEEFTTDGPSGVCRCKKCTAAGECIKCLARNFLWDGKCYSPRDTSTKECYFYADGTCINRTGLPETGRTRCEANEGCTCTPWKMPSCQTCNETGCLSCQPNFFLVDGRCLEKLTCVGKNVCTTCDFLAPVLLLMIVVDEALLLGAKSPVPLALSHPSPLAFIFVVGTVLGGSGETVFLSAFGWRVLPNM